MLTVPLAGTNYTLAPVVAIAAFILARRGHPLIAVHLLVVQIGSWLLNPLLKFAFPRDRPTLFEARGQHAFTAFPSGHAIATVTVLFTVAWLIQRYGHGAWGWWLALLILGLNAYSRIYLAVHWPTDVGAGLLIGAVWLVGTLRIFAPLHAERVRS
jgi:undecaprenyl-diphosphatase